MKLLAIVIAAAGLVGLIPQASAQTTARECRDVTVSEGGAPKRTTLCRDSDGQWRPVTANAAGQPLPASFRGKITYRGSFDVTAQLPPRGRQGARQDRQQGTIVSAVEYDGNLVTLNWTTNIGGQQRSGRATGTRQGSQCQLFEDKTQSPYTGTCDSAVFRGTVSNGPGEQVSWRGTYDGVATETVDYVVRDRERAEAARRREEEERKSAAARQQAEAAERRRIAAMPVAGAAATRAVETAVRSDSRSWMGETTGFGNRYDVGSVSNVRIASGSATNGTLRAEYRFNGGSQGWVEARMENGRVVCLRYWDTQSCAAVRSGAVGNQSGTSRPGFYRSKVDVSTLRWVETNSANLSDGKRVFLAASVVSREGSQITLFEIAFMSATSEVYLSKQRIDCRAMSATVLQEGVLEEPDGRLVYLVDSNETATTPAQGTVFYRALSAICSGRALRPVPDVINAGRRFVNQ